MPLFNYTPTKEMAQVTPVNYSAAPNLSFSRAMANLQEAAQMGGKLKDIYNQEQYDRDSIELEKKKGIFATRWEGSDFDTRLNVLIPELKADFLTPYEGKDNKYARALYKQGLQISNAYFAEASKEGVVDRHRDNEVILLNELQAFEQQYNEATTLADKEALFEKFDQEFVTPYSNNNSPQAQQLLKTALSVKGQLQKNLTNNRISFKDSILQNESMTILATTVATSSVVTQELWDDVLKKMEGVSDFEQNKGVYLNTLANTVIQSMQNDIAKRSSNPNATYEDAILAQKEIESFLKIQPQVFGSDSFGRLRDAGKRYELTVNNNAITDVNSNADNDNVPTSVVENKIAELVARNAISKAEGDRTIFLKKEKMSIKKVGLDIQSAITNEDFGTLNELIRQGKSNKVTQMVGEHLDSVFADNENLPDALSAYFLERAKYENNETGIGAIHIPRSEYIDTILATARNGSIVDSQGLAAFIETYKVAIDNEYAVKGSGSNMRTDYLVAKGLFALGRTDIVQEFNASRTGRVTGGDKAVNEIFDTILRNGESFTLDMNSMAESQLKRNFKTTIEALLKADIDPSVVQEELLSFMDTHYIRASSTGKIGSGRIMIPRSDYIKTAKHYETLIKAINYNRDVTIPGTPTTFQERETIVVPKDFTNPNGEYLVLYQDGTLATTLSQDDIKSFIRFGDSYALEQNLTPPEDANLPTYNNN